LMTTMRVVGECFFWYRLTRVFPDKFHRAVKRLCVCVCVYSEIYDVFIVQFEKYVHNNNNYYNCFMAPWTLYGTTQVSQYQKGKTNLDLLEQEIVSGSGISWAICKSAPLPRQITTPTSHHSVFYRPDALPATQPTASKH